MFVPVEPIVPEVPEQFLGLLQCRVEGDEVLPLLQRFLCEVLDQRPLGRVHWSPDLSEYLVGESVHPGGILALTLSSPGVGEELGKFGGANLTGHGDRESLLHVLYSLVTLPPSEPCPHIQDGPLALEECHPESL